LRAQLVAGFTGDKLRCRLHAPQAVPAALLASGMGNTVTAVCEGDPTTRFRDAQ
jgi:hypothetical protein